MVAKIRNIVYLCGVNIKVYRYDNSKCKTLSKIAIRQTLSAQSYISNIKTRKETLMYIPPFTISAEAINKIADISRLIERYAIRMEQEDALMLRKANKIKTIHSSLAIEGNTLDEEQVRDIVNGKTVVAPIRQIQEVKNAIAT